MNMLIKDINYISFEAKKELFIIYSDYLEQKVINNKVTKDDKIKIKQHLINKDMVELSNINLS